MFALLLRPQIRDTERQEAAVRASGLDWLLVQPVNLTDDITAELAFVSPVGDYQRMQVSRGQVGAFLAEAAMGQQPVGASVALSAFDRAATGRCVDNAAPTHRSTA